MKYYSSILSLLVVLLLLIINIEASIYNFESNGGDNSDALLYSYIYSNKSKLIPHSSPGNGNSYVAIDATVKVEGVQDGVPPLINIAIIRVLEYQEYISTIDPCCSVIQDRQGLCKVGTMYILDSVYNEISSNSEYTLTENSKPYDNNNENNIDGTHIYGFTIQPNKTQSTFPISLNAPITQSGLYAVLVLNCSTSFNIAGKVTILAPNGFLEGSRIPFLYYNLILSAFYVGLFIMWAVLFFKFKNTALRIQYWISFVIILGFLEAFTNYFTLSSINKTGVISSAGVFFVTLFGTLKSSFARALVVLVSLGYGVVVPRLPKSTTIKLVGITVVYLILKGIQNYSFNSPLQSNSDQLTFLLLTIPVSILDTVFYYWILVSLTEIMNNLHSSNQTAKLNMFRRFVWILICSALSSFIILVAEIVITWVTTLEYSIKSSWTLDVSWGFAYFAVLVSICWIWKPNSNNQKFAYSELSNDDNDDDVVLDSMGGKRTKFTFGENNNGIGGSTKSQNHQNDHTIESIDDDQANSFSIQDDDEDIESKEKSEIVDMFQNRL